ncbi:MAG TPA: 2'-5' RNA ligase family protein [Flavobacterium sp.]|nr:2'-5' RNA ligase family protein [Flavobacterium sp.]
MQNRYSLVISPPQDVIDQVKSMKEALAKEIGWYNSKNSLAHITINEFMASEIEMESIKKQLNTICNSLKPISVCLDSFNNYSNGAFFVGPDETSKINLKQILVQVNQSFRAKTLFKNTEPHLSIGRRLSAENLTKAYYLFSDPIELQFICDNISLRLFNPDIKQFEIIEHFEFKNNPPPVYKQGTLF